MWQSRTESANAFNDRILLHVCSDAIRWRCTSSRSLLWVLRVLQKRHRDVLNSAFVYVRCRFANFYFIIKPRVLEFRDEACFEMWIFRYVRMFFFYFSLKNVYMIWWNLCSMKVYIILNICIWFFRRIFCRGLSFCVIACIIKKFELLCFNVIKFFEDFVECLQIFLQNRQNYPSCRIFG